MMPDSLTSALARIAAMSAGTVLLGKATLLLAVGWLLHAAMAWANPRWRVLLWRGVAVGLVLLPLGAFGWPALEIRVDAPEPTEMEPSPAIAPDSFAPVAARRDARGLTPATRPPTEIQRPAEMPAPAAQPVEIVPEATPAAEPGSPSIPSHAVLLGIWGFGVVLLGVRLATGYLRLARLLRASQNAPEGVVAEARRIAAAVGCRRAVKVRSCPRCAVPFVCGLRRPVVVLPVRMCQPAYRPQLSGVLVHELAHVRARDWGWSLGLQVVSILLWFHPLAWRIGSAHRAACDAVCDAVSASYLGDVQAYCRTLARLALEATASVATGALAMARVCDVRRRIAVLGRRVFKTPLKPRAVVGVALVGLVSVALLAELRFALAEPRLPAGERKDATASPQAAPPTEAKTKDAAARTFQGKVIDQAGKPVAGAEVWLSVYCELPGKGCRLQHVKSDSRGRFTLEVPAAWVAAMVPNSPTSLWAYAAGHQLGITRGHRLSFARGASDLEIRLKPAADTSFVVLDPAGLPLAGALVQPYYVTYEPTPEEVLRHVEARTDSEGRAKLPAVGRDSLLEIRVTAKGLGIQVQHDVGPKRPLSAGEPIRLRPAGRIEGQVIADKPEWARGVRLVFKTISGPWSTEGFALVESDEQGRFAVPAIAVSQAGRIDALVDEKLPVRPRPPQYIQVEAGRTTEVQFPMIPLVPVRGSIRVKDTGEPIPGAKIAIQFDVAPQGAECVSDAQGRFTAQVLPGLVRLETYDTPGNYVQFGEVTCEVPDRVKDFELPPLELVPTKSVAGRVLDEQDRPVAAVRVNIIGKNRRYGFTKTDANGQFNLVGVPEPIDTAKAQYEVFDDSERAKRMECELIKTDPLVLRVLTSSGDRSGQKRLPEGERAKAPKSPPPMGKAPG